VSLIWESWTVRHGTFQKNDQKTAMFHVHTNMYMVMYVMSKQLKNMGQRLFKQTTVDIYPKQSSIDSFA